MSVDVTFFILYLTLKYASSVKLSTTILDYSRYEGVKGIIVILNQDSYLLLSCFYVSFQYCWIPLKGTANGIGICPRSTAVYCFIPERFSEQYLPL